MEKLINKARNGDKEAFIEAILLIKEELYNIAFVKLKNIEDVNDVIQDTMINAFKNINKLKETKYFKSWIVRILINECNRFYREKYKRFDLFNKILKKTDTNIVDWTMENIDEKLDCKMDYDSLIRKLKPNEQIIIILYFCNNFTKKEIADILNISINTVKTRLRRAEEKLKDFRKEG